MCEVFSIERKKELYGVLSFFLCEFKLAYLRYSIDD